MDFIANNWILIFIGIGLLVSIVLIKHVARLFGLVIIPSNQLGSVIKTYAVMSSHRSLPDGKIVALHGEAGIQADTLAPGLHWRYWPWQYHVEPQNFTIIHQGNIGKVEAIDGAPVPNGRILGKAVDCNMFQDARKFLENGGQRGPQSVVIPPGTYRINRSVFNVTESYAKDISDNCVGIVTVTDGLPLNTGDIAGPIVEGHNSFQDVDSFIAHGGRKGLQEQVLLAGRYYLNPLFASVEEVPLTVVPIASVGVIISYVGADGVDVTGSAFQHGNLVKRGQKGVWIESLDPGKYPLNPYTVKLESVPTANVVLNWATGKSEAHKLDANLSTITVRSSDGFKFNLDVSQIIHIPRESAPKVISRFGSVSNLVTQVLEPTIGNYFRNAAQASDVIDFLKKRNERQDAAKKAIGDALKEYDVGAVDTLIGDITPPDELMKTLTDRKLAEQEQVTYQTQQLAEESRKEMMQAKAMADTQPTVVNAERQVSIAEFDAKAAIAKADGDARSKTINAEADAKVMEVTGNAQATKTKAVGEAEAAVIQLKTAAVGQNNYAVIEVGRALAEHNIKLVPDIMAGGKDSGGTLVDVLVANLIKDSMHKEKAQSEE